MKEFRIVSGTSKDAVEDDVNRQFSQGWEVLGGLHVGQNQKGDLVFSIALILTDDDD
jgi:hypothetical protein